MATSNGRTLVWSRGPLLRALLLGGLVSACHANKEAPSVDQGTATVSSVVPSASMLPPASVAPSATGAPPAASVALGDAPDVRVTLPVSSKAVVKVGQTFGILIPPPDDFLDDWELERGCPLGQPLTFISRGELGLELLWKIADDKIGSHVVKLRMMHRRTRTSQPTPTKRAQVTVDVVQ